MRVNGIWVGWGLGDNSLSDMTVRRAKTYMRRMFASYAGNLSDTNVFDEQMYDAVTEMQKRYVRDGRLRIGTFISGVLDLETQYVMGFKKRPIGLLPIIFTVEGHMSNMWVGPCASNASAIQQAGKAYWQPVGYDCGALPFNNGSGFSELTRLVGSLTMDNGVRFPAGCPWGIIGFSQGAQIVSDFMEKQILNNGPLAWRLKDFKRGLALGNPRRENNRVCSWAIKPPKPNTQGIMDNPFNASKTEIADRWAENATAGDMFAENTTDAIGLDKTAIAKIVTQNSWVGGQAALLSRILALLGNPLGEAFTMVVAATEAIMFLASNPNPHYSTVASKGDIEWMKGVSNA